MHGDALVTNGGRILSVTAVGPTVAAARERAYAAVATIGFDGAPLPNRHRRAAPSRSRADG